MLYVLYSLNGLLMIALPIILGIFLARRYGLGWKLFWIGAVTFILSQVGHIPFLYGMTYLFQQGYLPAPTTTLGQNIFNAIFLGLAAGVFEEVARYLVLRFWLKETRSWKQALMFGGGHGGIEAIILGVLVLVNFVVMLVLQNVDMVTLNLPAEAQAALSSALQSYWGAEVSPMLLMGAVERVFAICLHLSCTVMVMQSFLRKNWLWLGAAILWHAVVDALAVFIMKMGGGVYQIELVIGITAVISVAIIYALRPKVEPAVEEPAA